MYIIRGKRLIKLRLKSQYITQNLVLKKQTPVLSQKRPGKTDPTPLDRKIRSPIDGGPCACRPIP